MNVLDDGIQPNAVQLKLILVSVPDRIQADMGINSANRPCKYRAAAAFSRAPPASRQAFVI
jgi:hypothetical protein